MDFDAAVQFTVFALITALIGFLTWWKCHKAKRTSGVNEFFLAGSGLSWPFVAGSITMTNINTDTLTGFNGPQTLNIVWFELAGIGGLVLLAVFFLPVYYHYKCTTVTELLERRYGDRKLRGLISAMFLLGNVLIFLPAMLYTSSLLLNEMFGLNRDLLEISAVIAAIGAAYAIFGGLRAVAVGDTYNTVLVLGMALLVVVLALNAVNWDLSGLPPERAALWRGDEGAIVPWPTLFTGMIFSQLYYFSVNQNITQRALAAPSLREAQRGAYAAALLRLPIVPVIVVVPGLCAYLLYGEIGQNKAYGVLVTNLMPKWLQGAFAAAMVAAVVTSFNSVLNASAALYVCDFHLPHVNPRANVGRWSVGFSLALTVLAIELVPIYQSSTGIMATIQSAMGTFSMPTLAAFMTGLLFRNVDARSLLLAVPLGVAFYWLGTSKDFMMRAFGTEVHFLHVGALTVFFCVGVALLANAALFGRRVEWAGGEWWGIIRGKVAAGGVQTHQS